MEPRELDRIVECVGSRRAPATMTTKVVAIDGPGGAGKTTLAAELSASFGTVPIVHTDDFASWDDPLQWWPRLLAQVLEPLGRNERTCYQRYDWDSATLAEWRELEPGGVLLLEGVTASRQAFGPYLTFTIWVETPRDERLRRGLERDGENSRALWERWMAQEDTYIETERPMLRADLVLSGAGRR